MSNRFKKFRIEVLGCRTNQYEAQGFRDQLKALGYEEAEGEERADLCLVNSCTVTQGADSASRREIRKLVRQNPGSKVVVTGCLATRRPDLVGAIEGVTHVVDNSRKEALLEEVLLEELPSQENWPEFKINRFEGHSRAFVKVQDGCNSFCTYCIIPYVRGRSRSRTPEAILSEIEGLVSSGHKEVVITGINVGDFESEGMRLAELMRKVDQVPGIQRVRLSSIDPDEVDDALLQAILEGSHTCHSMHIVLQAGSNAVLKRMNRKYTKQIFLETIERIRAASSDFTFTTDVIFGFPGESEADFEETLSLIEAIEFAKVHFFPYSKRERTRAASYPGQIDAQTLMRRKERIKEVSARSEFSLRNRFLGKRMELLLEGRDESDPELIWGHTANFLKVAVRSKELAPNSLVEVDLIENGPHFLTGRAL